MPTKSKNKNLKQDDYDLSLKQHIIITSLLYISFSEEDIEVKDAVLRFCALNLSDKEFKKIYKSCIKFLSRLEQDKDEFDRFLRLKQEN